MPAEFEVLGVVGVLEDQGSLDTEGIDEWGYFLIEILLLLHIELHCLVMPLQVTEGPRE